MTERDLYEVLGVTRNVTDSELKIAYRRMAMKYHPDRNPGNHEAEIHFKEVKAAYEVLSDSQKRAVYDQFGHAGINQNFGAGGGFGGADFGDIFDNIFGDMFGGRARSSGNFGEPGADLRYNIEISLEEAVFGKKVEIKVPTYVKCDICDGSGAKKGSSPKTCGTCEGHGQVRIQQGFFSIQQTCPTCRGKGKIISDPCMGCHGQGRKKDTKVLTVNIPAGVDEGDRIRLSGEGEMGMHGGPAGDLYVQISVRKHDIFVRDGNNLRCEIPVRFVTAALGGEVTIPTLNGQTIIKIQAGTQSGKVYRLRSKGVTSVRGGGVGDLLCAVVVETPVNLNKKQKELLEALDASLKEDNVNHSPKESSWFDSVKRFFSDMKS